MSEEKSPLASLSQDLAAAVERAGASVVAIDARQPRPAASGVHWRPGVVVATNHTIRREERITVTLPGGASVPATLAGRDPSTDLAVLRLDAAEGDAAAQTKVAETGDAAALRTGQIVLAVGRTDADLGATASFGIVGATAGAWRTWRGGEIDRFLRLDLAIYLGFSGGALVGADGLVYGINTSALARGAALAIPASTVNRVVDQLLESGRVARPYIGVGLQPVRLPASQASALGLNSDAGLIAITLDADAPAAAAGMLIGDILIALGGSEVRETDDVQAALRRAQVGGSLTARVLRGGQPVELTIIVGERPQGKR